MTRRALGSVVVLVSILTLPYWIYFPVLFLAIILFPFFWEGILLTFLVDILYGSEITAFPFISPLALSALVVLVILLPLRKRLRLYV